MKVLFVHTISNSLPPPARPMGEWFEISFSLSYLSAVLKAAGHETSLVVLRREKYSRVLDQALRDSEPALVCYTAVTTEFPFVTKVARYLREKIDAYHVIGGIHCSVEPREAVEGPFDAICIGEGEGALAELAAALQRGERPRGIENLWIRNGETVEKNPTRPFAHDLDGLPYPDRKMWRPWVERAPKHALLLGRGCSYSCSYCSNHALKELATGPYVRLRSPASILEELEALCAEFPETSYVYLETETIAADLDWAFDLAGRLERFNASRRTPLEFAVNLRVVRGKRFPELFAALKRAGFVYLRIGIESGSERVRKDVLRRNYRNEDLTATFDDAREAGLATYAYNLIGLPGESPADFLETVEVNRRCQPDQLYLSIFHPYPGTALHRLCLERGIVVPPLENSAERYRARLGLPEFPDRLVEHYFRRFTWLVCGTRRPLLHRLDDYVWRTVSGYPRLERLYRRLTGHGVLSGTLRATKRLTDVVARPTRSRSLARAVLGLPLPRLEEGEHYVDAATLALLRSCRRRIPRGARVLDLGAGSFAVIGLWLWRHRGCEVTCTEIDPSIAARARESIRQSGAPLDVIETSLFEDVPGEYDIVVFNPPYVPTRQGLERKLPEHLRTQWDGGEDGLATIRLFLDAFASSTCAATALLGVNRRRVPRERLRPLIEGLDELRVEGVDEHSWPPVDVYVLVRTKSPRNSTSSPVE